MTETLLAKEGDIAEIVTIQPQLQQFDTREEWQSNAVKLAILDAEMLGYELPSVDKIRVATGFPSTRAKNIDSDTLSQCFPADASSDHTVEIFVSPTIDDPVHVMTLLFHQLGHVHQYHKGLPFAHRGLFKAYARQIGLDGSLTQSVASGALTNRIQDFLKILGPYPHAALNMAAGKAKQPTKLLKVWCEGQFVQGQNYGQPCGLIARVTEKHLMPYVTQCWNCDCSQYRIPMKVERP